MTPWFLQAAVRFCFSVLFAAIVAIDTASNTVTGKLAIHDFAVDAMTPGPDGTMLYVIGSVGLYVIDTDSLSVTRTVPSLSATSQAVTPDGKYLYIASVGNTGHPQESVEILSTANFAVVTTIPLQKGVSYSPTSNHQGYRFKSGPVLLRASFSVISLYVILRIRGNRQCFR